MNRFLWLVIIFILLLPSLAWPACSNLGGGSWQTDGNELADVNECMAVATSGDTVNVIAGDGEATWASALAMKDGVAVVGPGAASLRIIWTGTYAISATSKSNWRFSGFELYTTSSQTAAWIDMGSGWRMDSLKYNNTNTSAMGVIARTAVSTINNNCYGLVDSNEIINGKVLADNGTSGTLTQGALWNEDDDMGSGSAVYIEDNSFTVTTDRGVNCMDASRGGKYVYRYNDVTQCSTMAHSVNQGGSQRGTRKWEIYGNDMNATGTAWMAATYQNAGTGLLFGNDFTSSGNYAYNILLSNTRSYYGSVDDNTTYAGRCDGDNALDTNTNPNPASGTKNGWPCLDQIGRGKANASSPLYLWSNYEAGTAATVNIATFDGVPASHIVANRDYYDYATSFDGTTGTGCGTLAARPATCTTGVAYWATDQSCSDISNAIGASPSAPFSGVLYKCTAANTWTAYYTPYQYPHPTRAAGTSYAVALIKTRTDDADGRLRTTSLDVDLQTTETSGSGSVQTGTTLIFEATEYTGMGSFVSWGGDCASCGANLQCLKTVSGNLSCSGEFGYGASPPTTYALSVIRVGSGSGYVVSSDSSINCGSTCSYDYEEDTVVTLSAQPTLGSFVGWSGGGCSGTGTCIVTMSAAREVKAKFLKTVVVGDGYNVRPGRGGKIVVK